MNERMRMKIGRGIGARFGDTEQSRTRNYHRFRGEGVNAIAALPQEARSIRRNKNRLKRKTGVEFPIKSDNRLNEFTIFYFDSPEVAHAAEDLLKEKGFSEAPLPGPEEAQNLLAYLAENPVSTYE